MLNLNKPFLKVFQKCSDVGWLFLEEMGQFLVKPAWLHGHGFLERPRGLRSKAGPPQWTSFCQVLLSKLELLWNQSYSCKSCNHQEMSLKHYLKLFLFLLSSLTVVACAMKGKGHTKQGIEWVASSGNKDFQPGVWVLTVFVLHTYAISMALC